eukprot:CFRG4496T1
MSVFNNQKRDAGKPPDKGSFPLDRQGICKKLKEDYLACLKEHVSESTECRFIAKQYLDCRMSNDLMARENWDKLGLADVPDVERRAPTNAQSPGGGSRPNELGS